MPSSAARWNFWFVPTWLRAGWILKMCPQCLTLIYRLTPKTMCTALGARGARALKGWRLVWLATKTRVCWLILPSSRAKSCSLKLCLKKPCACHARIVVSAASDVAAAMRAVRASAMIAAAVRRRLTRMLQVARGASAAMTAIAA